MYLPCLVEICYVHLPFEQILHSLLVFVKHGRVRSKCHVLDHEQEASVEDQFPERHFDI